MNCFPNIVSVDLHGFAGHKSKAHIPFISSVPVKYEHVVFCRPSELQLSLYRLFISSSEIQKLLRGKGSQPLKAINILKKLCNHPGLLDLPKDLVGSEKLLPDNYTGAATTTTNLGGRERAQTMDCQLSGKFVLLERYVLMLCKPRMVF